MFDYSGGWMWLVVDVLLVAVLAAVIWVGISSYRRRYRGDTPQERSRQVDHERHEATHRPR